MMQRRMSACPLTHCLCAFSHSAAAAFATPRGGGGDDDAGLLRSSFESEAAAAADMYGGGAAAASATDRHLTVGVSGAGGGGDGSRAGQQLQLPADSLGLPSEASLFGDLPKFLRGDAALD